MHGTTNPQQIGHKTDMNEASPPTTKQHEMKPSTKTLSTSEIAKQQMKNLDSKCETCADQPNIIKK